MNAKFIVIWIFATSLSGYALPKERRQVVYYRLPQQNKKNHPEKSSTILLPLHQLQHLAYLYGRNKKNSAPSLPKGGGIIIFYQNREQPPPQKLQFQDWLSKILAHTNGMIAIVPRKPSPQHENIKNDQMTKKHISAIRKLTKPIPKSPVVKKPLPTTLNTTTTPSTLVPSNGTVSPPVTQSTLGSPKNYTLEHLAIQFPIPNAANVSEKLNYMELAKSNKSLQNTSDSQSEHQEFEIQQSKSSTMFTPAHGLNVMPSLRPVYRKEEKTTKLPPVLPVLLSPHVKSKKDSKKQSPYIDLLKISPQEVTMTSPQNTTDDSGIVPRIPTNSPKSLASRDKDFKRLNYHVTNFTYLAEESSANRRISSEPPQLSAESTEFLPLTFFNPFPLIHSHDESVSEQTPNFGGDFTDGPTRFFHPSESRKRNNNPLGSGNFEIIRGGIFKDGEASENNLHYDSTPRGSYNRDYNDYNGPSFDSYEPFSFPLFNALSERRSVSVPTGVSRLRFGGTQLIPRTTDLLAMD